MLITSNNAASTLASSITATATSLAIQTVDAAKFPEFTEDGQWHPIYVLDSNGHHEIMRCTNRVGAVLTVERAQEDTIPRTFAGGARVELRLTAKALDEIASGYIANNRLPERLQERSKVITDWDDAVQNGFFIGDNAQNAPESGWCLGEVMTYNDLYVTQLVHQFLIDTEENTRSYRRQCNNGTWGNWERVRLTEAEQKAVFDQRYVGQSGNQEIDGDLKAKQVTVANQIIIKKTGPDSNADILVLDHNDKREWLIRQSNKEEKTGDNNGANMQIFRYDDSGAVIDEVVGVSRKTGIARFAHKPTHDGNEFVTEADVDVEVKDGRIRYNAGTKENPIWRLADRPENLLYNGNLTSWSGADTWVNGTGGADYVWLHGSGSDITGEKIQRLPADRDDLLPHLPNALKLTSPEEDFQGVWFYGNPHTASGQTVTVIAALRTFDASDGTGLVLQTHVEDEGAITNTKRQSIPEVTSEYQFFAVKIDIDNISSSLTEKALLCGAIQRYNVKKELKIEVLCAGVFLGDWTGVENPEDLFPPEPSVIKPINDRLKEAEEGIEGVNDRVTNVEAQIAEGQVPADLSAGDVTYVDITQGTDFTSSNNRNFMPISSRITFHNNGTVRLSYHISFSGGGATGRFSVNRVRGSDPSERIVDIVSSSSSDEKVDFQIKKDDIIYFNFRKSGSISIKVNVTDVKISTNGKPLFYTMTTG